MAKQRINHDCLDVDAAHFIHSAPVAMLTVDPDLQVTSFNESAAGVFEGLHGGVPLASMLADGEASGLLHVVRSVLRDDTSAEFELQAGGDQSRPRLLNATVWPVRDEASEVCGAGVALIDITRRVQQTSYDRKMRALAIMAGKVAHHFNNILGGVVTRVDFARQSSDLRVLRRCLNSTASGLQRATTLLDGLLAFAEADYRDADLADLKETIINFIETTEPGVTARGIDMHVRLADIPVIPVPRNQFEMVLENIVGNALDVLSSGGRLSIEVTRSDASVVCRISDSGGGIREADFEHIFEPFFSTKGCDEAEESAQHPGLGLPMALGIVHEMGGEITIDSRPGAHTAVSIHIPIPQSGSEAVEGPAVPGRAPEQP